MRACAACPSARGVAVVWAVSARTPRPPPRSCEVHWKAGKDLTHETVKKKGKGGKKGKTVTKVQARPSFFRFFESLEFDESKASEMEQDEVMAVRRARPAAPARAAAGVARSLSRSPAPRTLQIYQQMQAEADVGFALKNKIVPNAVHWFTGEVRACVQPAHTRACALPLLLPLLPLQAKDDDDEDEDYDEGAWLQRERRRRGQLSLT